MALSGWLRREADCFVLITPEQRARRLRVIQPRKDCRAMSSSQLPKTFTDASTLAPGRVSISSIRPQAALGTTQPPTGWLAEKLQRPFARAMAGSGSERRRDFRAY